MPSTPQKKPDKQPLLLNCEMIDETAIIVG